jgi:hypothetical protein
MKDAINVEKMTPDERREMLKKLKAIEQQEKQRNRDSYEAIRADVVNRIEQKVRVVAGDVKSLFDFVKNETASFFEVMQEYGQLKRDSQLSYCIVDGKFKIEVKTNKVKRFDERADVAATRLIEFLQNWISEREDGIENPMYQLAMTLLERNKYGDLDYKSISKLYDLESKFNNETYSNIMLLFKESNIVEGTARNYYFFEKTDAGIWRRIEISFNRIS